MLKMGQNSFIKQLSKTLENIYENIKQIIIKRTNKDSGDPTETAKHGNRN